MINNEDEKENVAEEKPAGYIDTAYLDIQCHLVIKDKDTGEIILNTRG
jgi:hypothetical protein